MCPTQVPAEILDHILSFLHSDRAALRACSQSHPLLSRLAARYLYSHILLRPQFAFQPPKRPSDLADLLSSRPDIGRRCIRSLKIHLLRPTPKQPAWEEVLTRILPALSALNELTLDFFRQQPVCRYIAPGPVWQALPETVRLAFLSRLRLPTLRHLSLVCVPDFPWMSLLPVLQGDKREHYALEHLTVERCFVCDDDESNSSAIQRDISLDRNLGCDVSVKALSLRSNDEKFLEAFVPWATTFLPRIQSLDFEFRGYLNAVTPNNSFMQLLRSYSNTLTNLCLDIRIRERLYYYDFCRKAQLDEPKIGMPITLLSCLPRLEVLTIRSSLIYYTTCEMEGFYSIVPWISQLFTAKNRRTSDLKLKSLSLHFDCNTGSQRRLPGALYPHASNLVSEIIHESILELVSNVVGYRSSSSCGEVSAGGTTGSIGVELVFEGGFIDAKNSSPFGTRLDAILLPLLNCECLKVLVADGVLSIKSSESDGDITTWVQDSFPDL